MDPLALLTPLPPSRLAFLKMSNFYFGRVLSFSNVTTVCLHVVLWSSASSCLPNWKASRRFPFVWLRRRGRPRDTVQIEVFVGGPLLETIVSRMEFKLADFRKARKLSETPLSGLRHQWALNDWNDKTYSNRLLALPFYLKMSRTLKRA